MEKQVSAMSTMHGEHGLLKDVDLLFQVEHHDDLNGSVHKYMGRGSGEPTILNISQNIR